MYEALSHVVPSIPDAGIIASCAQYLFHHSKLNLNLPAFVSSLEDTSSRVSLT